MKNLITRLVAEEDGATMVEYALMVALIAVLLIGTVTALKDSIVGSFEGASDALDGSGGGGGG